MDSQCASRRQGSRSCYASYLKPSRFDRVLTAGQCKFSRKKEKPPLGTAHQGQTRRIELVGEYDISQKPQVAALFGALEPGGPATIDMTKVTYIDSSLLNELVRLRLRFIPHQITLVVGHENVRRLLRIVKFDRLFEIQAPPRTVPASPTRTEYQAGDLTP